MKENKYDFKLMPLEGEPSCREIIFPLVPNFFIKKGDILIGRPVIQGCPITHVMQVINSDDWGVITVWIVGMLKSRQGKVKDIGPYNVLGFHGIAKGKPKMLTRQRFLPCNCMMQAVHTGVVNFINGDEVKIESIII